MSKQAALSHIAASMKEKAETAYLNGEIATAHHLSTVALEHWPDGAPLQEVSWCFAILLHCYKSDTDYYWLNHRFYIDTPPQQHCRFSVHAADDATLIAFLLEALRPAIASSTMHQWRNTLLQMTEPRLNDDVSTALLLETVVEMLCFFGVEEWETIGLHLADALQPTNMYVSKEVTQCVKRLSIQTRILKGAAIPDRELHFLRPVEASLALAWKAYFDSDFLTLDTLIPQLSNAVSCGDEYFLSVQGLVTATELPRFLSQNRIEQNKISAENPEEPWQYARYYRYQRFETERPLSAFLALREANAKNVAHNVREMTLSGENVASQCQELFRLLPGLWSSALKYWDLLSLLQLYALKMEFHWASACYFKHGTYSGEASQAVDAIICSITSLRSDSYKRKDAERLIGILEQYGSDEDVQRLYDFILEKAPPVAWSLCVEWLRRLSDLLPEHRLSLCLHWTEQYRARSKTFVTRFNIEEYYYLHPILQHYTLNRAQRESLTFHFEQMFRTAPHKIDEFTTALWYLADNDWEMCQTFMENMLSWDDWPRTQALIINSCVDLAQRNPNTREFCAGLLQRKYAQTGCKSYARFASIIEHSQSAEMPNLQAAEAPDLQSVYTSLRTAVDSISPSGYNSQTFQAVHDHIDGFDWSKVNGHSPQGELLKGILEIAAPVFCGDKAADPLYIVHLLQVLRRIFQFTSTDAGQMLIDALLKHMEAFRRLLQPEMPAPKVWDMFCLELYRPELLHNELLLTFCNLYHAMTPEQKTAALSYAEDSLYCYPKQTYYPTYLFLRAAMDTDDLCSYTRGDQHDHNCSGFVQLRMIAANDVPKERSVLPEKEGTALSGILQGIASAQKISGKPLSTEKTGALVIPVLKLGARSLSAAHRLQVASLIKTLPGQPGDWPTEVQEIRERLAADKRKSVRNAVLGLRA